ncbi:MAG: hypothetical protein R3F30_11620 [Planctomycetota bacterium]
MQCNQCAFVCPHATVRTSRSTTRGAGQRRPRELPVAAMRAGVSRTQPTRSGRARGLHRLHALRRDLPGQGQDQPAARPSG